MFANPNVAFNKIRFVSLAYNKIGSAEAGAVGKSLEHVWLTRGQQRHVRGARKGGRGTAERRGRVALTRGCAAVLGE